MAMTIGQVAAVHAALTLAGYEGDLRTLPVDSEDERIFTLSSDELHLLQGRTRLLEQVVQQILGRKVAIIDGEGKPQIPFE